MTRAGAVRAVRLLLRGRPPWRRALFQAAARSDARAFAFSYRISRAVKLPCFSSSLSFFWLTSQFPKSKLFSELVLPGFRAREPPFLSGFSQGFAPLSFTVFSSPNTLSPINPFPSGLCLFSFPHPPLPFFFGCAGYAHGAWSDRRLCQRCLRPCTAQELRNFLPLKLSNFKSQFESLGGRISTSHF